MTVLLLCLLLCQIKHLIVDWCWQTPYELCHKGIYGHWGGIQHAGKNAIGTALCFVPALLVGAPAWMIAGVLAADFAAHLHIDWLKVRINTVLGLTPDQKGYWAMMGADQTAHQLCYLSWAAWIFLA